MIAYQNEKEPEEQKMEEASDDHKESEIKGRFDAIISSAWIAKSLKHAKRKLIVKNMQYVDKDDCIDCICGSKMWIKKNKSQELRTGDLHHHLIENEHKKYEKEQSKIVKWDEFE